MNSVSYDAVTTVAAERSDIGINNILIENLKE